MTKNLKYELTEEFTLTNGKKLFRIRALKDLSNIKKGDLGGFIEKESNLSHEGDCWIYDDSQVSGNAQVYRNGQVYGNAVIYGDAQVSSDVWMEE